MSRCIGIRRAISSVQKTEGSYTLKLGAWKVTRTEGTDAYSGEDFIRGTLSHHSTLMLTWNVENPTDPEMLDYSEGWGSKSDQDGMNAAFQTLDIPLYFSRAGGARFLTTERDVAVNAYRRRGHGSITYYGTV